MTSTTSPITTTTTVDTVFRLLDLPQPLVQDILLHALTLCWTKPTTVFLLCRSAYEYLRPQFLKRVCLGGIDQVRKFAESDGVRRYGGEVKSLRYVPVSRFPLKVVGGGWLWLWLCYLLVPSDRFDG